MSNHLEQVHHVVWGTVTILQRYESFWMVMTAQGKRSVYEADCKPLAEVVPLERKNEGQVQEEESTDLPATPSTINLNDATITAIAKALPMIGRLSARRIVERRGNQPDSRYTDFAHFQKVNEDLLDDADNWAALEPLIKFED